MGRSKRFGIVLPDQALAPQRTTWHISWGTYGARLHHGPRLTVDRRHNQLGEPFLIRDDRREQQRRNQMTADMVLLTNEQRMLVESIVPEICVRGDWTYRLCACGPERDHVHVLLDIDPSVHGKEARKWLKRWVGEALDARFGRPESGFRTWWAEGGSTKAVKNEAYLNNCFRYLFDQRATTIAKTSEPDSASPAGA